MAPKPRAVAGSGSAREADHRGASLQNDGELNRLVTLHASDLITLYETDGTRVYASPSVERTLGPLPRGTFDGIHPDDREAARQAWIRTLAGENTHLVFRHAHADGSWRWLEGRGSLVRFGGRPHVLAVTRDVTELKLAEQERQAHLTFLESMDKVNRAIQSATGLEPLMSAVLDAALEIFDCDRAWLVYPCDPTAASCRVPMERTRPEFPGAFVIGAEIPIGPDVAALIERVTVANRPVTFGAGSEDALPAAMAEAFSIQSQIVMAVYPKVDQPYAFGLHQCSSPRVWTPQEQRLFQEIGRRLADGLTSVLAYRNLRESEARFRMLMDHATDAFFLHDGEGRILDVNRQACESLGYTRDELIGARPSALFDPDFQQPLVDRLRVRLEAGEVVTFETRHRRKDGTTFPVEIRIGPFTAHGRRFGVSLARDITNRKRTERALLESHSLLKAILDGIPDSVYLKDREGRYLMINTAGAQFLGRPAAEIIGKTDFELLDHETARLIGAGEERARTHGGSYTFEETLGTGDAKRTFLATRSIHRDAQGHIVGMIGVCSDITELKELEEQLRHAQKMEAVGRLAGGVAHDFNNLLTVINSYSEMVFNSLSSDDPNRERVGEVVRAGERATRLTAQLLAFGRKQMLQPKVVCLNDTLQDLLKLLRPLIGEDIDVAFVPDAWLGLAKVDPGQFEQAIINLAVNARDAMPHGGRLLIETHNVELGSEPADGPPSPASGETGPPSPGSSETAPPSGAYVRVTVSDTGEGMDAATRARVFEPFFTTKEPGKGSGLGLAMVYGFVTQSGGHIEVESEPGRGSVFNVFLPRTTEPIASAASGSHEPSKAPKGGETVLLVEDEDSVRMLARIVLQSSGYTVLEAASGEEAARLAQEYAGPIHLLVSDLVMPHMSGRQLARQLADPRPMLRVLFMSGYPDDQVEREGESGPRAAFLQKPFTPMVLARKVREVLDGA